MATAKLDTRTALGVEPSSNDLVFIHRPSGLSYKMTWEVLKGLIEGFIAEGEYLDFGGVNQVSAAELKPIVDGNVTFTDTTNSFILTNETFTIGGQPIPTVGARVDHPSNGYTYSTAVQDLTLLGSVFKTGLSAINLSNGTGFSILADKDKIEIKAQVVNVTTTQITVEDGKIKLETPEQLASNISVGDKITAINIDGTVEFEAGSWTTLTRPATPYAGQDGFNTTLNQREYWNTLAWSQY